MRISAKGRYALAAVTCMAQQYNSGEQITVISIAEKLAISKIYLEQVFTLLKQAGLVHSIKGSQGGYKLTRPPQKITVFDVLSAIELSLFEKTQETVPEKAPDIEKVLQLHVFDTLYHAIQSTLHEITLADLVSEAQKYMVDNAIMFYI